MARENASLPSTSLLLLSFSSFFSSGIVLDDERGRGVGCMRESGGKMKTRLLFCSTIINKVDLGRDPGLGTKVSVYGADDRGGGLSTPLSAFDPLGLSLKPKILGLTGSFVVAAHPMSRPTLMARLHASFIGKLTNSPCIF